MTANKKRITGWQSVSALREIGFDISDFGYSKEFVEDKHLSEKKALRWENPTTGQKCFNEQLELKEKDGIVFWRENDSIPIYMRPPEVFRTQIGQFINHNHGEFKSWLGKKNYVRLPTEDEEKCELYRQEEYFIPGNFYDMFDCGEYTYAVSNLMHGGLGKFKIVRIDKAYTPEILFTTDTTNGWFCLRYLGRFLNEKGHVLIATGFMETDRRQEKKKTSKKRTILVQIDAFGNCYISKEWEIEIPSPDSFLIQGDYLFFGHNKMISRLHLDSGELVYFTNKSDEEIAALQNTV